MEDPPIKNGRRAGSKSAMCESFSWASIRNRYGQTRITSTLRLNSFAPCGTQFILGRPDEFLDDYRSDYSSKCGEYVETYQRAGDGSDHRCLAEIQGIEDGFAALLVFGLGAAHHPIELFVPSVENSPTQRLDVIKGAHRSAFVFWFEVRIVLECGISLDRLRAHSEEQFERGFVFRTKSRGRINDSFHFGHIFLLTYGQ